jgi:hypothetical protein
VYLSVSIECTANRGAPIWRRDTSHRSSFRLTASVGTEKGKEFESVSTKDNEGKWLVFYAYPKDFTGQQTLGAA